VLRVSFPEFLGRHTRDRDNIVIAGSFGKSTLTALAAVLMREAGRDPGYFIGAAPLDLATNATPAPMPPSSSKATNTSSAAATSDRSSYSTSKLPAHQFAGPRPYERLSDPGVLRVGLRGADRSAGAGRACGLRPRFRALRRLTAGARSSGMAWTPVRGISRKACGSARSPASISSRRAAKPSRWRPSFLGGTTSRTSSARRRCSSTRRHRLRALQRGVRRFRGVERRLDKKTRTSRVPAYEASAPPTRRRARPSRPSRCTFRPSGVVVFEPHTFSWRNARSLFWYDTVFEGVARVLLLPPPGHGAQSHLQLSQAQICNAFDAPA